MHVSVTSQVFIFLLTLASFFRRLFLSLSRDLLTWYQSYPRVEICLATPYFASPDPATPPCCNAVRRRPVKPTCDVLRRRPASLPPTRRFVSRFVFRIPIYLRRGVCIFLVSTPPCICPTSRFDASPSASDSSSGLPSAGDPPFRLTWRSALQTPWFCLPPSVLRSALAPI